MATISSTFLVYKVSLHAMIVYVNSTQISFFPFNLQHLWNYISIKLKCHRLSYDEAVAEQLIQLRSARVRIGTMDLKIAGIALARQALAFVKPGRLPASAEPAS
jgi:hypothetical protein